MLVCAEASWGSQVRQQFEAGWGAPLPSSDSALHYKFTKFFKFSLDMKGFIYHNCKKKENKKGEYT